MGRTSLPGVHAAGDMAHVGGAADADGLGDDRRRVRPGRRRRPGGVPALAPGFERSPARAPHYRWLGRAPCARLETSQPRGRTSAFLCRGFLAGGADEERRAPGGPSSFLRPISFPEMRVERSASQVSADSSAGSSTREKSGRMRDRAEVLAAQPALVGDGADDLARLDLVPLAHGDAVRRQRVPSRAARGPRSPLRSPLRSPPRSGRSPRAARAGRSASGSSSSGSSPWSTTASAAATSTSGTSCSLHVVGDDVAEEVDPLGRRRARRRWRRRSGPAGSS